VKRLSDFAVRWIDTPDRKGLGVIIRCVTGHCQGWNIVLFANPLDGGPAATETTWDDQRQLVGVEIGTPECRSLRGCGATRWQRGGETLDTLTLHPSVHMHECGHYWVQGGAIT